MHPLLKVGKKVEILMLETAHGIKGIFLSPACNVCAYICRSNCVIIKHCCNWHKFAVKSTFFIN